MEYTQRVAIVTGAATGIGRTLVERLSEQGALVVANDIDERRLAELATLPGVTVEAGDVSDPALPGALVAVANAVGAGRVDALFNNAAMTHPRQAAVDVERLAWDRNMAVNLNSYFYVAQRIGSVMLDQGFGAVLNVASTAGAHGMPNNVSYVTAKHGVIGLTRALAVEWAPAGVRVNAICPGLTETPRLAAFRESQPEQYARRVARVPLGRVSAADEQVAMAMFLNSDAASYVTGLVAHVDGGGHALYSGYEVVQPVGQSSDNLLRDD